MSRSFAVTAIAAIAATMSLSACSESTSLPSAPEIAPSEAKIALPTEATLSLHVTRTDGLPIGPNGVTFTSFTGGRPTVKVVEDNGPGDLDSRLGYYRVKIAKSQKFEARVSYKLSLLYAGDASVTVSSNNWLVDMGTITMKLNPSIQLEQWDGSPTSGLVAAGGSFNVSRGRTPLLLLEDNGHADMNNAAGKLRVVVEGTGTYTFCEATTPAGFQPLASCFNVTTGSWGQTVVKHVNRAK